MTRTLLGFVLLLALLGACSDSGTFVILRFDDAGAPAGISSIDLTVTLGTERAELSVAVKPGLALPFTKGLSIASGAGNLTVDAVARDGGGQVLATAHASGTVVRGRTVMVGVRFGTVGPSADAGPGDGGVADAAPPPPIDAGPGGLVCSPPVHDFGKVAPGQDAVKVFTVTNTGEAETGVVGTSVKAGFLISRDDCSDKKLAPRGSCTVEVTFHAGAPGKLSGFLSVVAAPGGVTGATFDAVALEPATLVFMPPELDFGAVVQGGTASARLQLANPGGVPTEALVARIEGADPGAFQLVPGECDGAVLGASATCNLSVVFAPASPGKKNATLFVAAGGAAGGSAPLSGTGLLPGTIMAAAPVFAATAVGSSTTAALKVTNVGDTDALVGEAVIGGSDAAEFSVAADGCRATTLAAGGSCTITIGFAPLAPGAKLASLTVSASPGGQAAAPLAATATAILRVMRDGMGRVRSSPDGIDCGATCAAPFASGSVQLTATPDLGWSFGGWSGGGCGAGDSCTVSLAGDTSVAAPFAPRSFPLMVTVAGGGTGSVSGGGIDCGATCGASLPFGTMVTLTATPAAGSTFSSWSGGGCVGSAPTCVVTMTDAQSVIATFQPSVTVTIQFGGAAAGSVAVAGGPTCTTSCQVQVASGSPVMLDATAAADAVFAGWTGGGCGAGTACSFMPTADTTVMATFEPGGHVLTLSFSGTGGGTVMSNPTGLDCSGSCSQSFTTGTPVTLTAEAAFGSTFAGWQGACSGTGSCQVTLDGDVSVTAKFDALPLRTLSVTVSGTGSGTVGGPSGFSCSTGTCTKEYVDGTTVDLSAMANAGSLLKTWSGDCTGTGACSVVLSGTGKTVGAQFEPSVTVTIIMHPDAMFPTTVTSNPAGISCTTGTCSHVYLKGATSLTLSSTVSAQWGVYCEGSKSCNLSLTSNRTIDVYPGKVHFHFNIDYPGTVAEGQINGFLGFMSFGPMGTSGTKDVVVAPGSKNLTIYWDVQGTANWVSIPGCSSGDQCNFNLQDEVTSGRVLIED